MEIDFHVLPLPSQTYKSERRFTFKNALVASIGFPETKTEMNDFIFQH